MPHTESNRVLLVTKQVLHLLSFVALVASQGIEPWSVRLELTVLPLHHFYFVRMTGVEPAHLAASVPKTDVYTVPPHALKRGARCADIYSSRVSTPLKHPYT